MKEFELIKRCQAGDEHAFEALFGHYGHKALKAAFLITKNTATAEDTVQEAFIQCFRSIGKLRDPGMFQAWFYRILIRLSWRMHRKEKKHIHLDTDCISSELSLCERDFTEDLERRYMSEVVQAAMCRLDLPLRTVIALYYFNELPVKQIAKILNCFEGTVKSRLYTARKRLEKEFTKKDLEELGFGININKIYLLVRGAADYQIEVRKVLKIINGNDYVVQQSANGDVMDTTVYRNADPKFERTALSGRNLKERLGFDAKVPRVLPGDFTLKSKKIAKSEGHSMLLCGYDGKSGIYMAVTDFPLNVEDDREALRLTPGDVKGRWLETYVRLTKGGELLFGMAEKPDMVKINHVLTWQDSGVCYTIMDSGNNLPQNEMMEMALAILQPE